MAAPDVKADEPKKLTKEERKAKLELKKKMRAEKLKKKIKLSVPVPEGLKKSWERENRAKDIRLKRKEKRLANLPAKLQKQARNIEAYEKEYADLAMRDLTEAKKAKMEGNFYKPADAKVAIVIRIRGINRVSPKVRKVLQLFRLLQIHNAVFIRLNKATINMLKLVQPYIAYGYPDVDTIRALIYKRGFAKIRSKPGAIQRIPIMSNDLIEKHLGKYGLQTVEDLVHEIATSGKRFTAVANFLWPFKLQSPRKGYRGRKRRHFLEGGSYGNWERYIKYMVKKML